MLHVEYFFFGAGGAASLELIKLYEYRGRLHLKTYQALVRSPLFWAVVIGMLAASGFIAWSMYADRESVRIWDVVITGVAARSIIREVLAARESGKPTKLGGKDEPKVTFREIFS